MASAWKVFTRAVLSTICLLGISFIPRTALFAEELNSPTYGYYLDLPEGCQLADKDADGKSYIFSNSVVPVNMAIKVYGKNDFKTSLDALNTTLNKLNAEGESEKVDWRNEEGAVGSFKMKISGIEMSGWGMAAILPNDKGTIVCFTWCQSSVSAQCNQFMISALDSLSIDRGSLFEAGIMTTYAYPVTNKKLPITLTIDGKAIKTELDSNDSPAATFVVEREFGVLSLYAQQNALIKDALLRYYRMIFRDSFKRMQRPAFDIYNTLAPDAKDETDLAQKLLTWTQSFEYDRAKSQDDSDFTSLPDVLLKKGNDCDSRSMLIAVLLQNMNIDSIMFVSGEYSHAMAGLVSTHPGQSIKVGDKKYLTGETTAKGLTWGKLPQDMSDFSKWFAVVYP